MNNVLLDALPHEWNGYIVNTWFQIGVQLTLLWEDEDISDMERMELMIGLLFENEDGTLRDYPKEQEELEACVKWFMNGWYLDNEVKSEKKEMRIMDYDIDQWRIFADFLQIYHIDLSESDMHWWMFQGLLWNMPQEQSSFMQCLSIRQKKPRKGATAEEKKAIELGHKRFDLKTKRKKTKSYTTDEEQKIDTYDAMMAEARKKKSVQEEALSEFAKLQHT